MGTYIGDVFQSFIEIPASQYKVLKEQNDKWAIDSMCINEPNDGYERNLITKDYDNKNYIDYITQYRYGCSDMELVKRVCKDGFRFLTKKEIKERG